MDRRRLLGLGGRAAAGAAGAAVVGLADPSVAGAATGRSSSSTRSGVVTMTSARMTVAVPGGLTSQSRVLLTTNSDPDVLGYWPSLAGVPDPATGTIKIRVDHAPAPSKLQVAWMVVD